jgi:hypothetical protein
MASYGLALGNLKLVQSGIAMAMGSIVCPEIHPDPAWHRAVRRQGYLFAIWLRGASRNGDATVARRAD